MFFTQLDTITSVDAGQSLRASKCLSLAEEYLQDHFPRFPVMPGVLMLEAVTQAGAWLVRATDDFAHSMVVLKEARNVKYSGFVSPGERLDVEVTWLKRTDQDVQLKAAAKVGDRAAMSARIVITSYNLRDGNPVLEANDQRIVIESRKMFERLNGDKGKRAPGE